jgi:hypothetical protein
MSLSHKENIWKVLYDQDILNGDRAEYGEEIVSTLGRQLSWSHFREIIYQKENLQREFYAEMCRIENWSIRMLRRKSWPGSNWPSFGKKI